MYIYKTICVVNNKIYIGQCTKQPHLSQDYLGSGTALNNAIKKHGKHNFVKEILKQDVSTQQLLNKFEQIFIKKFDSTNRDKGYNILLGGGDCPILIEEIRLKMN